MEYIVEFIACTSSDDGVSELKYSGTKVIKRLYSQKEAEAVIDFIDNLVDNKE